VIIHLFLVDLYNNGEHYMVGLEGKKEEAEEYLKKYSKDVSFIDSKEKKRKDRYKGKRKVGSGLVIKFCEFKGIW
jgi:hypothetical protein